MAINKARTPLFMLFLLGCASIGLAGEQTDNTPTTRQTVPASPSATKPAEVTGPYFGQKSPGKTPEIFAPGILSLTNRMEARIAFSPDGNECFFTVPQDFHFSSVKLYYSKRVDNTWTPQVPAPFSQPGYSYSQPFFSADGNRLYFSSNKNGSVDIWTVERAAQGWGAPQVLPSPVNTAHAEGEYSQTTDGTAYIESDRPGGQGLYDVWRIRPQQTGQPLQVENLGPLINSSAYDSDPFVSPDGRFLVYSSDRPGGYGAADLYVTFADGNGGWTAPVNMNKYCPGINTDAVEYGPSLSPDGRYLFFVRLTPKAQQCDVYWVENPFA
jgi:Tol biopolymer transport system component